MSRRIVAVVAALTLAGCGGSALKYSFNDYSGVYADTQNRQLLLNLARMSKSHPPHFLQLGLINATWSFGSSITASANSTRTHGLAPATATPPSHLLSRIWTWVVGASTSVTETPTFSMTPLSGPQFAQGFLAGVPPQVFFTLLEQGEPIDQLLRILVHSIDFSFEGSTRTVTIANTPSRETAETWAEFLRLTGILRELQIRGLVSVHTTAAPAPVTGPLFEKPTLEDTLKAREKGMMLVEVQPGKFGLTTFVPATALRIDPEAAAVFQELGQHPYFRLPSLARAETTPVAKAGTLTLRLRSFFSAMSWMSVEQRVYDELAARPGFLESIPPTQRRPVLRLKWTGVDNALPPLVSVRYDGDTFAVTDQPGTTWNRDVFTLLSYIESQISLDPKNLPVQQLINVR